jgi:ABC-2 type transport system permease protein
MSALPKSVRQAFTVARRDFIAAVATPTFIIFLLAPLLMLGFGAIGGVGASMMGSSNADQLRIVAIAPQEDAEAMHAADARLRTLFSPIGEERPPTLRVDPPAADPAAQARALFATSDVEVTAALYGPLDSPTILFAPRGRPSARYLAQLAEQALLGERADAPAALSEATLEPVEREEASLSGKSQIAFFGAFGLFFLVLLLSGQAVGTMAEERSNKVIEVLAAAVPLESVFFGKLVGTFGVALLFLIFWGTVAFNATQLIPEDMARLVSDVGPAIGFPLYPILFFAYFTMAFMLMSAVFLGIGAQASTQRELQMMSLPITIFQMAMLGLASAAAAAPDGTIAVIARIFPFSSPFAMIADAATSPALLPHLIALAWQLLWVALTIAIAARWFRRGVLQSGGPGGKRKRRARKIADDGDEATGGTPIA